MVRHTWGGGGSSIYPPPSFPFLVFGTPQDDISPSYLKYRTIYHDTKSKVPYTPMTATDVSYPAPADSGAYEAGLTTVGEFETVESYCRYFNWLKPPSKLERNSNYHLFKSGI